MQLISYVKVVISIATNSGLGGSAFQWVGYGSDLIHAVERMNISIHIKTAPMHLPSLPSQDAILCSLHNSVQGQVFPFLLFRLSLFFSNTSSVHFRSSLDICCGLACTIVTKIPVNDPQVSLAG